MGETTTKRRRNYITAGRDKDKTIESKNDNANKRQHELNTQRKRDRSRERKKHRMEEVKQGRTAGTDNETDDKHRQEKIIDQENGRMKTKNEMVKEA